MERSPTARRIRRSATLLLRDRRGEVALEYGLLVAMIAIALIGMSSLTGVADKQSASFRSLSDQMAQ